MHESRIEKQKNRSPARRYSIALLAPLVVGGVIQLTWPFFQGSPGSVFLVAVTFSAWYGGLNPGLLSVIISILLADYFFIPPFRIIGDFGSGSLGDLLNLAMVGPFISLLSELMHGERSQTESALQSSLVNQERYRKLAENFPNGAVITYDQDFRVTFIAGGGLKRNGQSPDFYMGKSLHEIVPPEAVTNVESHFRAAFAGQTQTYECPYPDGRVYFAAVAPLRNGTGEVKEILVISQNITERKKDEERLREYEKVVEGLDEMIMVLDRDYRYLLANQAFLNYHDLRRDQVIGRNAAETIDPITWEQMVRPRLEECFQGRIVKHDLKYPNSRLGNRDLVMSYFPIEGSDGIDQAVCILRDVTETRRAEDALREAERKYREMFENAGEGIFQSTPDGAYLVANPALARMHGFDSPEEMIRSRTDISREVYVDAALRHEFKTLIEAQGFVRGFEHQIRRRDGTQIWISVNARAVRDQTGKTLFYEGIVQDINQRKLAEVRGMAFGALARRLSGATTQRETGKIIAETAQELFRWDACNLDLYDLERDIVHPMLNIDTIEGRRMDITSHCVARKPTARSRRVIDHGPDLLLREVPARFDPDAIPFGDTLRPSASIMTVPVRHGAKVVGLLSIQSYSPRAYDNAALTDLQTLADYCGEALNRIHVEQSFYESEERFRQMAEQFEDVMWLTDPDLSRIVYVNPAYERVFRRTCESLHARVGSFYEAVHPDDRARVERVRKTQGKGDHRAIEYRIVWPGGSVRWIMHRSFPIRNTEGNIYLIAGIAQDVTERKRAQEELSESEERYRELFENAKDAIYVHDLGGRYTSLNLAAEKLIGYPREEIIGKHFSNFIAPTDLKHVRENLCRKLDAEGETSYEIDLITRERRRVPVEVSSRLIYENGEAVGVQGTARDITERKRAQEALRVYSRRLIEAQEAERQSLARELHDEIGQVLTAVRINLQTVQNSRRNDAWLPQIEESIVIVDEALGRIRDISLELRPSLLDELGLASALRWYGDRYGQRTGIATEVLCGFEESKRLPLDLETECFRIAQEALTNVARHARASRVRVQLENGLESLLLTIVDNGIGFDSDGLLQTTSPGLTLGLRGMRERAMAMNGRIKIESTPGNGTKIRASFPLTQSVAPR